MKSRYHSYLWMLRILGVFILTVGMTSPVLADETPAWTITKTHVGDFAQGDQDKIYTITVTNSGGAPTSGLITVTDTLPTGLIAQSISSLDPAWTCPTGNITGLTVLTCTRTAVMNESTNSVITLTVDVAVDAGQGADITEGDLLLKTVTNTVTVSGGGSLDPDTDNDITRIIQMPDLVIDDWELRNEANNAIITNPEPNVSFWIRMTVRNRGGRATGLFYPGVFLDGKPNYGPDHDDAPLFLGQITNFADYKISPAGTLNFPKGCLYYDPTGSIDPLTTEIIPERGNYTKIAFNDSLDAGTSTTVDVHIAYPESDGYTDEIYNTDDVRSGLKAGSYQIYLYVDGNCSGGDEESYEDNNSLQLPVLNIGSLPSGPTDVDVTIAGISRGTYNTDPQESMVLKYALDGGPVVIGSDNGVGIIASLNQWRRRPTTTVGWTGVSQSMALPVGLITNKYVFPRYDYTSPNALYNALLLANVDTVSRDITVTIAGTVRGTYTLAPSASQFVSYPGVAGGPVVVSSDTGAKIVASLYELIRDPSLPGWNGQSEMMGLPGTQLSDSYLIPIYFGAANPNTLNASLYIANADTKDTIVEIKIAGVSRGTYPLAASTGQVVKYALDGGPVEISSNNGAKIIASLNQWRRRPTTTVGWTGVSQSMALPVGLITSMYVFPRYDYTSPNALYNSLLLANVDTVSRDITVTIAGTLRGTYTLAPSASQFVSYPGLVGGPVVVSSVTGAKIVASLYELIRDPSAAGWNGQSEMMGLPGTQLSDQYLIPLYFGGANPNTLNASMYIAVP